MSFWNIIAIIIAIVLFILVIIKFDSWRINRRKNELMRVAGEFGTNVIADSGYSTYSIGFERNGTFFDGSIHIGRNSSAFIISFYLPPIKEKF